MYQGQLPMLTKGPFALFYGGDQIIPLLSEQTPGRGVPILIFWSVIFQVSLYIVKHSKSRNLNIYAHNLTKSLVENVLNMYGFIVIIVISVLCVLNIFLHHLSIEKNRTTEKTTEIVPKEIIILFGATMFCVVLPYIKSYALR